MGFALFCMMYLSSNVFPCCAYENHIEFTVVVGLMCKQTADNDMLMLSFFMGFLLGYQLIFTLQYWGIDMQ